MISIKDLISDLGGGRSVTLGAVIVVCSYVAANRYVETIETRFTDLTDRLVTLERESQKDRAFESLGSRFTGEQGADLSRRLDRLERLEDDRRGRQ